MTMEIEIVNVVVSASIGTELDLQKISAALEELEYDPERFPGAIYRVKEPKTALLFFRSGKIVCTGAKQESEVYESVNKLKEILKAEDLISIDRSKL